MGPRICGCLARWPSPSGAVTDWLPIALDEIAGLVTFVEIEHLGIAICQQAPHHDTADKAGPTSHQDAAAARRESTFGAVASGIDPPPESTPVLRW